ncbi:TonB dependent receptor [Chitinophaga horti]|uniref:TonB dependent receptor n=1 Tax=Chitinophaga horti TaxID=2920382 RepID=A0ABY6J7B2_9BACT|nr:TonB-dependent receptor [Chitinophaga horti]UYQ94181.1 TonB dependent receptor [Chitinophaga horti]
MCKSPRCLCLLMLLLLVSGLAAAQANRNGRISGRVTDAASRKPLEAATVSAVRAKDSSLITYAATNAEGVYRLTGLPLDQPFEVFITRQGYRDTVAVFKLPAAHPHLDSVNWAIAVLPIELKGVSVVAPRAPFTYRKDTLEFHAPAYPVKPNGTVRDLIMRLPGVVIDASGGITLFGKRVDRIQLEGKDFYAGDLDMSVENLPAYIIEKVQVATTYTKLDELTPGPKKRSQNLTINLTLKSDKKQGFLGKAYAAAGTQERYSGALSLNRLGGKVRFGAYGQAGNLGQGNYTGSRGRIRNESVNMTSNVEVGKKAHVDVDYSIIRNSMYTEMQSERINFLPDSSFTNKTTNNNQNETSGHNLNARMNYDADSLTNWNFQLSASFRNNESLGNNSASSLSEEGTLINATNSRRKDASKSQNLSSTISYRRMTRNRKGSLNAQYGSSFNLSDGDGFQYSINSFLKKPSDTLDQRSFNDNLSQSHTLSLELSYMLLKDISLAGGYRFNYAGNNQQRETFNATPAGYTKPDSLLSAHNRMDNIYQQPYVSLGYRLNNFGITLNGAWSFLDQRSKFLWEDSSVVIKQQQFSPSVTIDQSFEWGSINVSYNNSTSAPSPYERSPIIDNRNPLAVIIGNPSLKSTMDHSASVNLSMFQPKSGLGGSIALDGSVTQNQIVEDISYDSLRRQVTRFRNTNGTQSFRMSGNMNSANHIGKWMVRGGINASVSNGRDVSYLDAKRNEASRWSMAGSLNGGAHHSEVLGFNTGVTYSWSRSINSLEGLNTVETQQVQYLAAVDILGIKKMGGSLQYNYTLNNQLPPDMGRRMHRLAVTVERRFLKNERLTLIASVSDLFNNQQNVHRNVTPSYVENRTSNVLGRYFLLRLQFNFDLLHKERKTWL